MQKTSIFNQSIDPIRIKAPLHCVYYAFGSAMKDRSVSISNKAYRYGFNTQEKDDEIAGEGNSYTAEFWQYDSRLGRRFNVDPMFKKFPFESTYSVLLNNPITNIDVEGDELISAITDATVTFAVEVGIDFLSKWLLEGKSLEIAWKEVDLKGAGLEAGKSFAVSLIFPGSSAKTIAKLGKSNVGQLMLSVSEKVISNVIKSYSTGKFNKDGKFDRNTFVNEIVGIFIEATIESLIEKGFGSRADELIGKFKDQNKKIKELYDKRLALANKIDSNPKTKAQKTANKKRVEAYDKATKNQKTTTKAAVKTLASATTQKAGEEVAKKGTAKVANSLTPKPYPN